MCSRLSGLENYKISDLTEKAFPFPPWLPFEEPLLVFIELLEGVFLKPVTPFIYLFLFLNISNCGKNTEHKA